MRSRRQSRALVMRVTAALLIRSAADQSIASRMRGQFAGLLRAILPLRLRRISWELPAPRIRLVLFMEHSPREYQVASRYLRSAHMHLLDRRPELDAILVA